MKPDKRTIGIAIGLIVLTVILFTISENISGIFSGIGWAFGVVSPFIIGACLAFVINIPMSFFERTIFSKKLLEKRPFMEKIKRPVAMVLAILAIIIVITVVMVLIIPQLITSVELIVKEFPGFANRVYKAALSLAGQYPAIGQVLAGFSLNAGSIMNEVVNFIKTTGAELLSNTYTAASSVVGSVVNVVIGLIFSLYCLMSKETLGGQFRKIVYAFFKEETADKVFYILRMTSKRFTGFISGQCTEAVIVSVIFAVILGLLRFPYAVMISVTIGLFSLVPIVGSFLACVIGFLLILMESPIQAVWFVVTFIVVQQLESNIIYPKVLGDKVGLPSMWVLFSVIVGGNAFGFVGMISMIPISSVVYTMLRDGVNLRLDKKTVDASKLEASPESETVLKTDPDDKAGLGDKIKKFFSKKA